VPRSASQRGGHILGDPAGLPNDSSAVARAVAAAWQRRRGLLGKTQILRAVHGAADGLPGLAVDVAGAFAIAHWYGDAEHPALEAILDGVSDALPVSGVYLKRRPAEAHRLGEDARRRLCPTEPVRGTAATERYEATEGDIMFVIRPAAGLSYGVFPDQRDGRARVREAAAGKRVLNLFAYTGGFSLAAALGGAAKTVAVDAAPSALEWMAWNFAANDLALGADHLAVRADAFDFLGRAERRDERYDVVVCDPPGFSKVGRRRWSARADLPDLIGRCLAVTADGGVVALSVNVHSIRTAEFERTVRRAAPGCAVTFPAPPPDFPPIDGEAHLKSAWIVRS